MKKYFLISLMAMAVYLTTGCNNDEEFSAANVQWANSCGSAVEDIKWETISGIPNQTWTPSVADGATSETKVVTLETGKGRCISGGSEYEITINGTSSTYVLIDGATQTLTISSITAK